MTGLEARKPAKSCPKIKGIVGFCASRVAKALNVVPEALGGWKCCLETDSKVMQIRTALIATVCCCSTIWQLARSTY